MTDKERRPAEELGGVMTEGVVSSEHTQLELLAEAHRVVALVVGAVRKRRHRVPGVGTPSWWRASDEAKVAALLILGEAWLIHDPDQVVRQRLREMSYDLAEAHDWSRQSRRPSHAELQRRRGEAA